MAQTEAGQKSASRKLVNGTMGVQRTNERAHGKVASLHSPNVPKGATSQNTAALRKRKFIEHAGMTPPAI